MKVTDADRKRRKERRKKNMKQEEEEEEDPIRNLIDKGDDPDFFGLPYIWIQATHVILLGTAILAIALGGYDVEFAVFNLKGGELIALQEGFKIVIAMNFLIAVWLFQAEMSIGKDRFFSGCGWALKAVLLGGVASWQYYGRIAKLEKRKAEREREEREMLEAA